MLLIPGVLEVRANCLTGNLRPIRDLSGKFFHLLKTTNELAKEFSVLNQNWQTYLYAAIIYQIDCKLSRTSPHHLDEDDGEGLSVLWNIAIRMFFPWAILLAITLCLIHSMKNTKVYPLNLLNVTILKINAPSIVLKTVL